MDQLRALRVFVTVADLGSLTAAAREHSLSTPSVTRIIGELEKELGVVLLLRTTRSISLTDIGQAYIEDARSILQDLETANDAARGAHILPQGHLRVTASTMFGQIYITPIAAEYLDLYSKTTVEAMYLDRVVNIFDEGIDVAIRIGHLKDSNLIARHVGNVHSVVCGSPEYFDEFGIPLVPLDLHQHKLMGLKLASSKPGWTFSNGDLPVKPRLEFTSVTAAIMAAKAGAGLTRVLSYQIAPDVESGTLQTVLDDYSREPMPVHIIYREGRRASAKVRAFVDLTYKRLKENQFLTN